MLKTVIFDLDGTLLNTLDDLCDSVNHVLRELVYPELPFETVRGLVGEGADVLMARCMPGAPAETKAKARRLFRSWYIEHASIKTKPYDGVIAMLKALKERGIKTAVSSNKFADAAEKLCREQFGELVDIVAGEGEKIAKKPDPSGVYYILDELKTKKDEAVYVGDSEVDLLTAENAGIRCVSVCWGARSREFLVECGAEIILSKPGECLELLLKMVEND